MNPFTEPRSNLEGEYLETLNEDERAWLRIARDSYRESTDFMDANLRNQWERNLANFQNRHPQGSKYHTEAYKHRSRLYRPKTRAMVRGLEAASAAAFFSTADVISIQPEADGDPQAQDASRLMHELCNYRLTHDIPWFITCLGAIQDTANYGICLSHQYWRYRERDGVMIKDHPVVDLIPPENLRFSASSDWVDPINDSPYLIHLLPMYLDDVTERMGRPDPAGGPVWKVLDDKLVRSAMREYDDSTRQARHANRTDPKQGQFNQQRAYEIVWVHRYITRRQGQDWLFYTLGHEYLLTDPVPMETVYPHAQDKRPYVLGFSVLETHKVYNAGQTELVQGAQSAANEIANQRIDNVRLAMNKRYFVRQGQQIDYRVLTRNVPGGVVPLPNPQTDIKVDETKDVTASAYQEQDRINIDFDDLAGQFSTGTVQANRKLNETVGGMQLMSSGANQMTEYTLRLFAETWVEPVLRQLVAMEAAYESDENILVIAGSRAKLDVIDYALFDHKLRVSVNVGMGATEPTQRVEKFMLGLNALVTIFPEARMALNMEEVAKELFGVIGYQDGERFFTTFDLQGLLSQMNQPDPIEQGKLELEAQDDAMDYQTDQGKLMLDREKIASNERIALLKLQQEAEMKALELQLKQQQANDDRLERRADRPSGPNPNRNSR